MKRIVAMILPASPNPSEPTDAGNGPGGGIAAAAEAIQATQQPGTMKVEALVTDQQAGRMVAMLLDDGLISGEQRLLQELLEKEVESAGPEAQDLFARIVAPVERSLITHVYTECNRVKTRAAARLGINRNTLHKKLQEYGMADDADE
jgi:DNA-binding protein Fis